METIGQFRENIVQFAATRGCVRGDELIVGAADLFVELDVGRAPQAAALRVFVENAADKKRVISDVGAE